MIKLRPYQTALIAQARAAMRAGTRRILLQSPTGSGKTALTAAMLAAAAARGRRCWFVVHRRELLEQSVDTFVTAADLHVGIVAAGYPRAPLAPVQVCGVASLPRRAASLRPPDLIVWDECQHLASASWAALAGQFPNATQIGLTATPQRLDGKGLRPFFDTLVTGPSTADLIAGGYLSPYRLFAPGTAPTLAGVHRVAGDFNRKELDAAMSSTTVVGDALSHYRQHCPGARALVFAWSLAASRAIAQQFTDAGIAAAHVDGETPRQERMHALRRFRAGALRVLCNVDLFGEGLDVPALDAVFLLRPTQSLSLYLQQVGRGLRPAPGKAHVKIFDHVNNWARHGLPDDARAWTLDGAAKSKREKSEPMGRRCGACFGVAAPSARACPYCGAVYLVQAREVEQVDGSLEEADVDVLRQLGFVGTAVNRCQRCGTACEKRFCGTACFLAQRRQWQRRSA